MTTLVYVPEGFPVFKCSCWPELNSQGLFVLCAGQSWRGCSRQHLGQLSSTGTTSAPTWTSSGGTWECARSTMCYLTSEWLQAALHFCPLCNCILFCEGEIIKQVMKAQTGLLFHINTWLSNSRSVQRQERWVNFADSCITIFPNDILCRCPIPYFDFTSFFQPKQSKHLPQDYAWAAANYSH